MMPQTRNYLSFVLRMWKNSNEGNWIVMLKNVANDDCQHFNSLYELYVRLCEITNPNADDLAGTTLDRLRTYFDDRTREE